MTAQAATKSVDLKLEVVVVGVSDIDRAKAFYERLGWRLDADVTAGEFHAMQFTPPNSPTSIIFGNGVTETRPGALDRLILAVDDVEAARSDLVRRGVDVSEVFHFAAGPLNDTVPNARLAGRDPQGRSYFSFASFKDPDGNGWLLQEITNRFPGREWASASAKPLDVPALAELLHETEQHHGQYERTHGKHQWWDWYAPYFHARQNGRSPEEASAAADRYMEQRAAG